MMQHRESEAGRWAEMPFMEQMANIGSEVNRTALWIGKGKDILSQKAFERALELIDLTIRYGRISETGRFQMLREVCRMREIFCKAYLEHDKDNLEYINKYLMQFATAWQLRKNRHI